MKPIKGSSTSNVKKLCEKDIKSLLNVDHGNPIIHERYAAPKSANFIQDDQRFKFEILKDKKCKTVSVKDEKSKTKSRNSEKVSSLANFALLDKENLINNSKISTATNKRDLELPTSKLKHAATQQHNDQKSIKHVSREEVQKCKSTLKREISPIRPNPYAHINTFISAHIRKVKVLKRSKRHPLGPNVEDDYSDEFLDDIIINSKIQEKRIILPHNFLQEFNPRGFYRLHMVNWMLNVQYIFMLNDTELYLAVNLLDQILSKVTVPKNMYQLVSVTCLLISNKFIGEDTLDTKILLKISSNLYAEHQLLHMEKKILKILDFHIHTVEPSLFINAYLKIILNIGPISNVYITVYFVLDCAVHVNEYSSTPCSIIATACIFIAMQYFYIDLYEVVKKYFKDKLSQEEEQMCKTIQKAIISQLRSLKEDSISLTIWSKYKHYDWLVGKWDLIDPKQT